MKSKRGRRKSGTKIGLRLSPAAARALSDVATRTGLSKTKVLEQAILHARVRHGRAAASLYNDGGVR